LASLSLLRFALDTNLRKSAEMSFAVLLTSRPPLLLNSVSAFCAESSDVLKRLSAGGGLNEARERDVEVARLA
jgi:hypothetical protein